MLNLEEAEQGQTLHSRKGLLSGLQAEKLLAEAADGLRIVQIANLPISARRCCTSASSAARSDAEFVELADCTASSRIRCRLLVLSPTADSAVWDNEMPSLAFRIA